MSVEMWALVVSWSIIHRLYMWFCTMTNNSKQHNIMILAVCVVTGLKEPCTYNCAVSCHI